MTRKRTIVVAGFGTALLLLAVWTGLEAGRSAVGGAPGWLAVILVLLVLALSLWKLLRGPSGDSVAAPPWTDDGAIVETQPEATPDDDPISGTVMADLIDSAVSDAREEATVDAGLATVRTPLRQTLTAALRQGGWDPEQIETALTEGSWTDDRVAAAVLDEAVQPPERSLRHRLWAWLFPQKAIRQRTARAVGAVATAAEAALPPVVGQHAPRPVPVVEPTLGDLQRASDGSLRRAVEGRAAVGATEFDSDDAPAGGDEDSATAGGDTSERPDRGDDPTESPSDEAVGWPAADGGGD